MAVSPRNGPGFKNQSYEIQGNPCNHCGGHAFWMRKGALPAAKKAAAAAKSAAAAASAAKKRKVAVDSSSDSDGADELVQDSDKGSELESDNRATVTDHSQKVKGKPPRKSAVIPRCDFIFVLRGRGQSQSHNLSCSCAGEAF